MELKPSIKGYSAWLKDNFSRRNSTPSIDLTWDNRMKDKLHDIYVVYGKATMGFTFIGFHTKSKSIGQNSRRPIIVMGTSFPIGGGVIVDLWDVWHGMRHGMK